MFNRLGISYPELTEMQVRAIFQAAINMSLQGVTVLPEIMVPLVGTPQVWNFFFFCYACNAVEIAYVVLSLSNILNLQELGHQMSLIRSVAKKVFSEMGSSLSYKVGTMIEIPRAALLADEVY